MRTHIWLAALVFAMGLGVLVATPGAAADKADNERIAKLVKQLGSEDFDEREKASKELGEIGPAALDALRAAMKDGEAEVKARAAILVKKYETVAETQKILAAKKVHLVFKDTPVVEAAADFSKKSGYTINLQDPANKLKERTITLDTGEVTFWEAFDKFCVAAEVHEATYQEITTPIGPGVRPGGGGAPIGGRNGGVVPNPGGSTIPLPLNPPKPAEKSDTPPATTAPAPKEKTEKDSETKADEKPATPAVAPRRAPPPAAGGVATAIAVRPGGFVGMQQPNVIIVVDGKPATYPTCYAGSVRLRAIPGDKAGFPAAGEGEAVVVIELRIEPKMQVQSVSGFALTKAIDDQDQKLGQAPDAPAVPGAGPAVPVPALRPAIAPIRRPVPIGVGVGPMGVVNYAVRLKKGEKEAKALKEFAGSLSVQIQTPPEDAITADKISKAAGETFKGKDGGSIKVIDVKQDGDKITIKYEYENPNAAAGGAGGFGGGGIRILPAPLPAPVPFPIDPPPAGGGAGFNFQAPAPAAPPVAAPVQIQIQIGGPAVGPAGGPVVGGGFVGGTTTAFGNGLPQLIDDKGEVIQQVGSGASGRVVGGKVTTEYTGTYQLKKGQEAAKLVAQTSRMVTVEIPFSFKDVPLK